MRTSTVFCCTLFVGTLLAGPPINLPEVLAGADSGSESSPDIAAPSHEADPPAVRTRASPYTYFSLAPIVNSVDAAGSDATVVGPFIAPPGESDLLPFGSSCLSLEDCPASPPALSAAERVRTRYPSLIPSRGASMIAPPPRPGAKPKALFLFSIASLVAADVADSLTSWRLRNAAGVRETNPLFGGQFGNRAVAIKSATLGFQLAMEWIICRRHPERATWFTWLNFATAGSYGWAAAKNSRLR
jgi:hypothetical protein